MDELIKFLIEKLKTRSITTELLVMGSVLGIAFLLAEYFNNNPQAEAVLRNQYLQIFSISVLSIWLAKIIWRYSKTQKLKIITISIFISFCIAITYWMVPFTYQKPIAISIYFDESVKFTMNEIEELRDLLESEVFRLETPYDSLTFLSKNREIISGEEIRNGFKKNKILRSIWKWNIKDKLPILITSKYLVGSEWSNLLNISYPNYAVISIRNIGSQPSLSDEFVRRYVATSIIHVSLKSNALLLNSKILDNKPRDKYTGCLNDFHLTRKTYIIKSQKPSFCNEEADSIERMFGVATKEAVVEIFRKIGSQS